MLLDKLLRAGVVRSDGYDSLNEPERQKLEWETDDVRCLETLVGRRVLTEYQAARIKSGRLHGLVLGNYRVLERIGAGGMGVVFRGEHRQLCTPVAIKALHPTPEQNAHMLAQLLPGSPRGR